jgi:uncharacterized membrane protein YcfT
MKKTQFKISNKISLVVLYSIMINIYKPKDDLRHYVIWMMQFLWKPWFLKDSQLNIITQRIL